MARRDRITNEGPIKRNLKRLLNTQITLDHFAGWLMVEYWETNDPLANEIKLRLAEYINKHWTKPELMEKLKGLL